MKINELETLKSKKNSDIIGITLKLAFSSKEGP
jgi:hypothetical protein